MRSANLSDATVRVYGVSALQLDAFLRSDAPEPADCLCPPCTGRHELSQVDDVTDVARAHVQAFIGHLAATKAASTASNRYRALQQFFKWAVEEDEIDISPMMKTSGPIVPEQPVPVVEIDAIKTLLASLRGRDFASRRDNAIIRLFFDTGLRLSELAGINSDDVELDMHLVSVLGKGRRVRHVRYGAQTAIAMDRCSRMRGAHPSKALDGFWLPERAAKQSMPSYGVYQMLVRRARAVGLCPCRPCA